MTNREPLILDGKKLAALYQKELKLRVDKIIGAKGRVPTLATVLVGDDPASATYVKMKHKACQKVGLDSRHIDLPAESDTDTVLSVIDELNADPDVSGILLQHPVPRNVDERLCFERISPEKDVDGVTCIGFGRMVMGERAYGSATPMGIMLLLEHYKIDVCGMNAVVLGRSPILGKPAAMMLLNKNATVTICHSKTGNLPEIVAGADLVLAAIGKPEFVKTEWIKKGAVVIDAGYHPGGVGDVDFRNIEHLSAYTPVPGGVGPMTNTALILQTVISAERFCGIA
jgi:methylenetetrahydrofolate dehydrogenase (NADP+)/methenyltetrahydrofolate cyclohydrolase